MAKIFISEILYWPNELEYKKKLVQQLVKVYPNPAQSYVTVEFANSILLEEKEVRISNINGQEIQRYTIGKGVVRKKIDVSELLPGTYIINISTQKNAIHTEKLIIKP